MLGLRLHIVSVTLYGQFTICIGQKNNNNNRKMMTLLRVWLDYGEEVHQSIKNSAQDNVIWGNSWYGGQDGKYL